MTDKTPLETYRHDNVFRQWVVGMGRSKTIEWIKGALSQLEGTSRRLSSGNISHEGPAIRDGISQILAVVEIQDEIDSTPQDSRNEPFSNPEQLPH